MKTHWLQGALALAFALTTVPLLAQPAAPAPAPTTTGPKQAQPGRGKSEAKPSVARQVVEHLRQNNPDKFRQLMQLRKTDQKAFNLELQKLVQAWLKRNKQHRPPLSREELLCRQLSDRYHQTDNEEEKDALRRDLADAVEKAFEVRVKAMEARVQRMEKELQKFKERLDLLKKNRRTVCDDRLQELLRPPELDWNGDW